ncbi:Ig-like domain-containing protein [Lactococcus cremoris]|uniref:Ig-like domain-containing protein n=1 Tax=Lactococcus lactis subsp. cremoris TaxID=1359 RepID=UPI001E620325|nr:Ig-like domain-containing protein [Lactococcus cremoris]MCD6631481.1 Ig-like domain-containing protein [Lactococcus cremoris]
MNKKIFVPMATIGLLSSAILFANSASADTNMNVQAQDGIVSTDVNPLSETSKGQVIITGSGSDGLDLTSGNTITTGVLNFAYSGHFPLLAAGAGETEFVLVLPDELKEAAQDPSFITYFSGTYDGPGLGAEPYKYQTSDIRMGIDNEGNTIVRFTNPKATWGIVNGHDFNVDVALDLGTFVTKTGIRIANAKNGTHYSFNGAVVTDHDYTNIAADNTVTSLDTHALDPGYDLLQQVPTVEDVYDTDTTISGTGVPGAKIEIYAGGKLIATDYVGTKGTYHITVPKQNEGVTIEVRQNTGVGWSTAATTIVQHKVSEIPAPKVNPIHEGDTVVTGTGHTPGNTIIITDSSGQEIGRGSVDSAGKYSITLTSSQPAYSILNVVETDGKDTSPITQVVVQAPIPNAITHIDNFSASQDQYITGTYTGSKVEKIGLTVDTVKKPLIKITPGNGNFSIFTSTYGITDKSVVLVTLYDANDVALTSGSVSVLP